ncbi:MAG: hypothetical protein KKF65_02685 [Nanoarchaeota archaeon]|nr:hypothetical protein [Nanoarchaeota archaeon]
MKKNNLSETDRRKVREYFRGHATLQINENRYDFDDEAKHIRIGAIRKSELPELKKDQLYLFIGTKRGLINLQVNHRQIIELKKEIYQYEAIYLGKKPSIRGRRISAREVEWFK